MADRLYQIHGWIPTKGAKEKRPGEPERLVREARLELARP